MISSPRSSRHSSASCDPSPAPSLHRAIVVVLAAWICLTGLLSCLPVNPDEKHVEVVLKTDAATAPDSVVWSSGTARGHVKIPAGSEAPTIRLPLEHMGPAGITLEFWKDSLRTARMVYVPDEERGAALVSKEIDPVAIEILRMFDSLHTRNPSTNPRNVRTLSRIYAEGLLDARPAFEGYPENAPLGLSAARIDTLALRMAIESGLEIDSLANHWLLPLRADSTRKVMAQWLQRGRMTPQEFDGLFPDHTPRLDTALAMTCSELVAQGTACALRGSFSDDSAIASWSARILQGDADLTPLFEISPLPGTLPAGTARWSLRQASLRAFDVPSGSYRLRIEAADAKGQKASAELAFLVRDSGATDDTSAPVIRLLSPRNDTSLPAGSARIAIRATILDSSALERVSMAGNPATLTSGSEWMAEVPVQSGTIRLWVVAADIHGNVDSIALSIAVPSFPRDVRLIDLGAPKGYALPPATGDTIWHITVPNPDTALDLTPRSGDAEASILLGDRLLTQPIRIPLSPGGGDTAFTLRVRSRTGDTSQGYLIRIQHRPPDPIQLTARGGRLQTSPWSDSLLTVSWAVKGSRRLGTVRIDGTPAGCLSDTCSRQMTIDTGRSSVVIEAAYADLPAIWRDTIVFTRLSQPLANEAGLARFGTSLPGSPIGSDASWTLSVPNAIDWVLLAPVSASNKASFTIDDENVLSKTIFLSPDGDTSTHVVAVTSEDGSRTIRYKLRIEHAPPAPITFTPARGKVVSVPFDSTSVLLGWTMRGSRPLGWVELQNGSSDRNRIPLTKVSEGIYEHRFDFGANVYGAAKVCTVLVHAGYQGGVREWIDTVIAIRERDTTKPRIVYLTEIPKVVGATRSKVVQFRVEDRGGIAKVMFNQSEFNPAQRSFTYFLMPDLGDFRYDTSRISVIDSSGNSAADSIVYLFDGKSPDLRLHDIPGSPFSWKGNDTKFVVSGTIEDPNGVILSINGNPVVPNGTSFSFPISIQPGKNTLTIGYSDSLRNGISLSLYFNSVFLDDRDSSSYEISRMPDSNVWMLRNLRKQPAAGQDLGCRNGDCSKFGRWYSWHQALNLDSRFNSELAVSLRPQGLCPDGWRIPSESDWDNLFETIAYEWGYPTKTEALEGTKQFSGWPQSRTDGVIDNFLLPSHSIGDSLMLQFWLPQQQSATQASILDLTDGMDVRNDFPKDGNLDPAGSHQVVRCIRR